MKNLCVISFLLLSLSLCAQNQMKKWYIGPKSIDMPVGVPPSVTSLVTTNGVAPAQAAISANGIYDSNNQLVFYVADNLVLDRNNTILGTLPNQGAEIVILPFEGNNECQQKYHVFTTSGNFNYVCLNQIEVDMLALSVTTSTTPVFTTTIPNEFGGIALSQKNANGDRYLYMTASSGTLGSTGNGELYKLTLNSAGTITATTLIFPTVPFLNDGAEIFTKELDLSPDGKYLAWASYAEVNPVTTPPQPTQFRYHILELDQNGDYIPNTYQKFNIPGITGNNVNGFRGVEFYQSGSKTKLFLGAGADGIYYTTLPNLSVFNDVQFSYQYGFSQIEHSFNGFMYAISGINNGGNVCAIDVNALTPNISNSYSFILTSPLAPNASFGGADFFTLPDQIDGQDYNLLTSALLATPNTVLNYTATSGTWSVLSNPWNSSAPVYILNQLTIPSGVTLDINNMQFRFGPNARVVIEKGATLILNYTQFTSIYAQPSCPRLNKTWKGVEVNGDVNLNQTGSNQGKLLMQNASIIEFAECGVLRKGGGIISISGGSQFLDNKISVQLNPYTNFRINSAGLKTTLADKCSINTAYFYTTGNYPFTINPISIIMDGSYNIRIEASDFISYNTIPAIYENSIGILSHSSFFTVSNNSHFTYLGYGIKALRSTTNKVCRIFNSTFTGNKTALQIKNINYSTIRSNQFNIGDFQNFSGTNRIGLSLDKSSDFRIEDNTFTGSNASQNTIGILIYESGANENLVNNNQFNSLSIGNLASGTNRDNANAGLMGLGYQCNTNSGNSTADFVIQNKLSPNYGIKINQGSQQRSAGNSFSNVTGVSGLNNKTPVGINYYYANFSNQIPNMVNNTTTVLASGINNCITNPIPIGFRLNTVQRDSLKQQFQNFSNDLLSVQYNYHQLIDGGNTEQLINQIQQTWPNQSTSVYTYLMSLSPFVSEAILRETAISGILAPPLLLNILLNNPDATQNYDLLRFLEFEIPLPLSHYMISLIEASWDTKTLRSSLESNLSFLSQNKAYAVQQLIAEHFADQFPQDDQLMEFDTLKIVDPVDSLLRLINSQASGFDRIEQFVEEQKYSVADSLLLGLSQLNNLSEDQQTNLNAYNWYFNFRKQLANQGKKIDSLEQADVAQLINLRNSGNGFANGLAANLLCFYYHDCLPDTIYEDISNGARIALTSNAESSNNSIELSPNPANNFTHIRFNCNNENEELELAVTDLIGKVLVNIPIQKIGDLQLSTNDFANGIYLISIRTKTSKLLTTKLFIQH